MSEPTRKGFNFAKALVVLAVAFGVALGLCGVNGFLLAALNAGRGRGAGFGGPLIATLGIISLVVMALSAIGIVVVVIAWIIASAVGGARRDSDAQRLINSQNHHDDDRKAD